MPVFNNMLAGASGQGGAGYEIERSLRFNSGDSAYLNRTPTVAGNSKTWTLSFWVKRAGLSATNCLFMSYNGSSIAEDNYATLEFSSNDSFRVGYAYASYKTTTRVFRDPSAWYHIVVVIDTTNSTAGDRVQIYVNGTKETSFSATHDPDLNQDLAWNKASFIHRLGSEYNQQYSNLYLADVHFIDGQALAPTDFGETNTNNLWVPKAYSGTYGTNGFHLDFADNSSNAALGTDTSGNSNTFTVANLSVAAGANNDSLVDSPTNGTQVDTGAGGEVVGNYATLNPLAPRDSYITYAQGNLQITSTAHYRNSISTIRLNDGKYYIEATCTTISDNGYNFVGAITDTSNIQYPSHANDNGFGYYSGDGGVYVYQVLQATYSTWTTGDVIGFAYDSATGKCWVAKNGVWQNSGNPAAGTGEVHTISTYATKDVFYSVAAGTNGVMNVNFGQRSFAYTAPSGYKALCTSSLPTPTIADGSQYFDTKLWTGNGTSQTITALGFSPDLVWAKGRNTTSAQVLVDNVRGAQKSIFSDQTTAELDRTSVTAFNSDGFTLGDYVNTNGNTNSYVGWAWDAGSSTVSNTNGTITSQVRANPSAGFSIVKWTCNGSEDQSIGHSLGATPAFMIFKNLDRATNWTVYHKDATTTTQKVFYLNTTGAVADYSGGSSTWWGALPTSSVFTVGDAGTAVNHTSGDEMISYCFAPVEGYSAMGSYQGNQNVSGPFVYTGFKVAMLWVKRTDVAADWFVWDKERGGANFLCQNGSYAENVTANGARSFPVDILSNGFKIRTNGSNVNGPGTFAYIAFAENPFKTARAR